MREETECGDCEGSGVISGDISAGTGLTPDAECETCDGTGKVKGEIDSESDEARELKALKALADQGEGCGDWSYGETLINDDYFETYARELADDLGLLEHCDKWPATCIDWEKAAEELQQDYTSIDFDGTTFWMRS